MAESQKLKIEILPLWRTSGSYSCLLHGFALLKYLYNQRFGKFLNNIVNVRKSYKSYSGRK